MPDETPVTVTDLAVIQQANVDSVSGQWIIKVFARVFLVASRLSIVCLSVFNISQKVRNGF